MLTGSRAPSEGDAAAERRAALLLLALRLTRNASTLPRLEAALAAVDDGQCPPGARQDESALLRRLQARLSEALRPEDDQKWFLERWAEEVAAADEAEITRYGRRPPGDATPEEASALRGAGQLLRRLDRGTAVDLGDASTGGWRIVAQLDFERLAAWEPSRLWALVLDGEGVDEANDRLVFVAAGGPAPMVWDRGEVEDELERRLATATAAEGFARDLRRADPVRRAARRRIFMNELRYEPEAHEEDRHGRAVIHVRAGRPMRATGVVLLGPGGEELATGVDARRVDAARPGRDLLDGAVPTPDPPWAEQVWVRRLPFDEWRRGRLRPEPDRVVFEDEPGAGTPERGDGALPGGGPATGRSLGRDMADAAEIRRKAANCAVYASLLYAALANTRWRHCDGAEWHGGQRSAGALVAAVVGTGDYLDWALSGPSGVVDEEVAADLRALGWEHDIGA